MKFSYNWIRELVPGLETAPDELMRLITMKTAECEGLERVAPSSDSEPDSIIEVDNKSLTHRPDLWGHFGMAREVAAITGQKLRDPVDLRLLPSGPAEVAVEIEDLALCPRYSALVFENVTVMPSPLWLQRRLESVGLNAINNIVDVTNYVMAEFAQPMHAFDADKLHGGTIFVRCGRNGEAIATLFKETDQKKEGITPFAITYRKVQLTPLNLVIADSQGPIAIAGVIGGLDSAIGPNTKRIVLESANFQAASVRKTSVALKLRTDASMRFEKSQDPVNTTRALARAMELLKQVSPGIRLAGGLADRKAELKTPPPIELTVEWLSRKLGRPLTAVQVGSILESLAFGVTENRPGHFSVKVPSWRATKDISIKDDLLEEVGRMVGYDSITPQAPLVESVVPPPNPSRRYERRIRNMAAAQGFTEVQNYSFVNEEMAHEFGLDLNAHVKVRNPIASDQSLLRVSLLPGIRKNLIDNSRWFTSFRLFEIGREIHTRDGELPQEIPHFAAAMYERDGDGSSNLFELKRLAECFMQDCEVKMVSARPYEHPERASFVLWRGREVGRLFELHPSLGIEGRAAVLDLDLSIMEQLDQREKRYEPLRRFPTSAFDLSVVAKLREPAGEIEKRLSAAAGSDLVDIEFVRVYTGSPLPEDRKSVSYRLTVGASEHTLSSNEAAAIRQRIIEAMRASGYEFRA